MVTLSDKYQLDKIKKKLDQYLCDSYSSSSSLTQHHLEQMQFAHQFGLEKYLTKLLSFFIFDKFELHKLKKEEIFYSLPIDLIKKIPEVARFNLCSKWVRGNIDHAQEIFWHIYQYHQSNEDLKTIYGIIELIKEPEKFDCLDAFIRHICNIPTRSYPLVQSSQQNTKNMTNFIKQLRKNGRIN